MKIEIEKKDLQTLVTKAHNIIEKRTTMPVLVNVLLDADDRGALKVFATDLEVSLTDESRAQVSHSGRAAVNAKSLFDILKELPDGILTIERTENNWVKLTQNKSVFNIVGIAPEEYPIFPSFVTDEFMKIEAATLKDMIEKTIFSVANDETRYHLNGVFFEKTAFDGGSSYRMVATDGHRLSLIDRKVFETNIPYRPQGIIIPRKGLNEIKKMLDLVDDSVEMAVEGSQLIVRRASTVLMIRLIEGRYPNYQQLIPQNLSKHLTVNREMFLASIKRVSLLSNSKSKGVTLSFTDNLLEISSNNPELGDAKEEIEVEYKGHEVKIGFNARYILDVLNSMSEPVVRLEFNDQLSPGLVRPLDDLDYTCVVMPMRI